MMTEKAEWAKMYVLFRQLSDVHKREIIKKAEALISPGVHETPEKNGAGVHKKHRAP
jgi:hypothetical protein